MSNAIKLGLMRGLLGCLGVSWVGLGAIAQVIPDRTLPKNSAVTVKGTTTQIDGGTTVGANLFHSFSTFSVGKGTTAFFNNGLAINNILARVTGASFSNIDGVIKANGSANLFLMNPNGILFGPNASLDIGGSFVATTANAIQFPEGIYSAVNPQADSLLTINVPVGLQYGKEVQPIFAFGSKNLQAKPDQTLALVGGDVSLYSAQLSVSGGRLELGGLAEPGTVGLTFENNIPRSSIPKDVTRANVLIKSTDLYSDDLLGNGAIAINAKDIDIIENSILGSGKVLEVGGDIILDATDDIKVDSSGILSFVENFQGSGGNIEISAGKSLSLNSASAIQSATLGDGRSGDIKIATGSSLLLDNESFIAAYTESYGNTGDINISTGSSLSLNDQSQIKTYTTSNGYAGDINITSDSISGNTSYIISFTNQNSLGAGGSINIFARELSLNGTQVGTSTAGKGNAGDINIKADSSFSLENQSKILTYTGDSKNTENQGNAGDINIFGGKLSLSGSSGIANSTYSQGDAGNIRITATDSITLDGAFSRINLGLFKDSTGNGGDLKISTNSLFLKNGAFIASSTQGLGTTGDILINATDQVEIDGASSTLVDGLEILSNISSSSPKDSKGQGGDIVITTGSLYLTNGGSISALKTNSTPTLKGNIRITATDAINISGTSNQGHLSKIASSTFTNLPSGDITIKSPILNISNKGIKDKPFISAASFGTGNSGQVLIEVDSLSLDGGVILNTMSENSIGKGGSVTVKGKTLNIANGGGIFTNTLSTQGGKAGDINITLSENLNLSGIKSDFRSRISASSEPESTGDGGNIFIDSPKVTITDSASLFVSSLGSGKGGNISLFTNSLKLDNGTISAATTNSNGGNVNLTVRNLLFANNNSIISATAGDNGNGGNLTTDADLIALNGNSDLTANAVEGQGGNIKITTQGLFQSPDSDITASSQLGIDGTVQVNTPGIDPNRGLVSLPENTVDASSLVSQQCSTTAIARNNQQSEFIITGRGGIPANPSEPLQNDSVLTDWITLQPQNQQAQPQTTKAVAVHPASPEKIVVAQGWVVDKDGTIVLTAPPSNADASPWQAPVNCHGS